jgi:hypothetical protein
MVSGRLPDDFRNPGPSGSTIDLIAEVQEARNGCTAAPGNTNRSDPTWLVNAAVVRPLSPNSKNDVMAGTRPATTKNESISGHYGEFAVTSQFVTDVRTIFIRESSWRSFCLRIP